MKVHIAKSTLRLRLEKGEEVAMKALLETNPHAFMDELDRQLRPYECTLIKAEMAPVAWRVPAGETRVVAQEAEFDISVPGVVPRLLGAKRVWFNTDPGQKPTPQQSWVAHLLNHGEVRLEHGYERHGLVSNAKYNVDDVTTTDEGVIELARWGLYQHVFTTVNSKPSKPLTL